jgi:hypothetical protein
MNVDSDERRIFTWAGVGFVVPFVGRDRGYAELVEQVWVGLRSLCSRASLGLLTNEHPGPLRGLVVFPFGPPGASSIRSKRKNPSCLSAAGVFAGCGEGGIRTPDTP